MKDSFIFPYIINLIKKRLQHRILIKNGKTRDFHYFVRLDGHPDDEIQCQLLKFSIVVAFAEIVKPIFFCSCNTLHLFFQF